MHRNHVPRQTKQNIQKNLLKVLKTNNLYISTIALYGGQSSFVSKHQKSYVEGDDQKQKMKSLNLQNFHPI